MKYLVSILSAVVIFSACNKIGTGNKELHCPPYDPTTLNTWFPYDEGATYYYKDSSGDKHWLAIQDVSYTNGDEPSEGWNCMPATECYPSGSVFAYRDINQYDKIWLNAHHVPTETGGRITLAWNSTNTEIIVNSDGTLALAPVYDERPEQYYEDIKPGFVHHANLYLNEVSYTDVYEITLRNNDMGNARKVYLVKNKGIVGYETQDGRSYWIEQ